MIFGSFLSNIDMQSGSPTSNTSAAPRQGHHQARGCVLHGVVKQSCAQRLGVEAQAGADFGDLHRVRDEVLARLAFLVGVALAGEGEGHDDLNVAGLRRTRTSSSRCPTTKVVHGKAALLRKLSGDEWQQFATLRALYAHMWAHPGKQLLFMGGELAQGTEWSEAGSLDWYVLDYPLHAGVRRCVADLNRAYRDEPALWEVDFRPAGFQWLVGDAREDNVLAYARYSADGARVLVSVVNFSPVVREGWRCRSPPPAAGWRCWTPTPRTTAGRARQPRRRRGGRRAAARAIVVGGRDAPAA